MSNVDAIDLFEPIAHYKQRVNSVQLQVWVNPVQNRLR
jgi:hypothetical protein